MLLPTCHTLSTMIVYLLLDQKKLEPLRKALGVIWARHDSKKGQPSWVELEQAPMAIGGMNRTPRVFPHDGIEVCGRLQPKGTPVSMSTYWMHNEPVIFPIPESFEPSQRISNPPEELKAMRAHFFPFAKGSRACLGQNLVYMQLYHTVTHIFRPDMPRLTLYDTTLRDDVAIHGLQFPMPPIDSNGVRAKHIIRILHPSLSTNDSKRCWFYICSCYTSFKFSA